MKRFFVQVLNGLYAVCDAELYKPEIEFQIHSVKIELVHFFTIKVFLNLISDRFTNLTLINNYQ